MFNLSDGSWHALDRSGMGDVNIIVSVFYSVITGRQERKLEVLEAHSNSYEPA